MCNLVNFIGGRLRLVRRAAEEAPAVLAEAVAAGMITLDGCEVAGGRGAGRCVAGWAGGSSCEIDPQRGLSDWHELPEPGSARADRPG